MVYSIRKRIAFNNKTKLSKAVSSYPSDTSVANVSKSTTKRELISIEGVNEEVFRMNNLNLILGSSNAIEYVTEMFGMPKPEELLQMFQT